METKSIKSKKILEENKEENSQPAAKIPTWEARPEISRKSLIFVGIVIILIIGYFALNKAGYIKNIKPAGQAQNQTASVSDQEVLARLKTLILLPDDIMPTMAIINDADLLRQKQPVFFANVKNGDRLIIYPDLAIIYDYQANKIIKVGPVQNAQLQNN